MRIRKKPWTANELETNPRILRDREAYKGRLAEYFSETRHYPIHVEIGCGKGRFITQTAARNSEINYVAIERDETVLAAAARLSLCLDAEASLVFLPADAEELPEFFIPGDIRRLYINFCDPWHRKKKWAKRRLTHVNFLAMYEQLQIDEIFFKTDNRILFEFSINQFSERGWILRNISLDLHNAANSGAEDNIMTEYEEKFSSQGPIYRLEAYNRHKLNLEL